LNPCLLISKLKRIYNLKINAIDLFCGAGGLTHGFEKAGIVVKLGIDNDPACEYPYTKNNNADFLLESVENLKKDTINDYFKGGEYKLLAGCAPCQTFSTYNQKADPKDSRWKLLDQFSRLVKESEPDLVTMENVPGLVRQNIFTKFVDTLKNNDYYVYYRVVNSEEYGLPQHRNRLVLLASKLGEIRLLSPEELKLSKKTVRQAIGKLPPLLAGEIDSKDPLHQASSLSDINLNRIQASKPGGSWKDWDDALIASCHKKKTGNTYRSVYGRMSWDETSPTITTQYFGFGNGRFGHPDQNRAISLREGAILQSFPRKYKFVKPGKEIGKRTIGKLIGNAVPVILGEVIGKSIINHVENL